jgi:hypothetical protein
MATPQITGKTCVTTSARVLTSADLAASPARPGSELAATPQPRIPPELLARLTSEGMRHVTT